MATTRNASQGILSDDRADEREQIIGMLTKAYWMEMETVISYLSNSSHLDGVRAEEIAENLAADVEEELGHAKLFADTQNAPKSGMRARREENPLGCNATAPMIFTRPSTTPPSASGPAPTVVSAISPSHLPATS